MEAERAARTAVGGGRLAAALAAARGRGRKILIPYVMLGDPDLATSVEVAAAMAATGADALELGLPFSDPMADGPVIQAAGQRALAGGLRVPQALEAARHLRARVDCPLALMTYVNPIVVQGAERFAARAGDAGLDALVVPDVPLEESAVLGEACRGHGLDLVLFVAPTSTDERIQAVARAASGFVYCVSVAGITGERLDTLARVPETVARVRAHTDLPLLVGFGINGPQKAIGASRVADGVIVASWIVQAVADLGPSASGAERASRAAQMVTSLREALDRTSF